MPQPNNIDEQFRAIVEFNRLQPRLFPFRRTVAALAFIGFGFGLGMTGEKVAHVDKISTSKIFTVTEIPDKSATESVIATVCDASADAFDRGLKDGSLPRVAGIGELADTKHCTQAALNLIERADKPASSLIGHKIVTSVEKDFWSNYTFKASEVPVSK